MSPAECLDLIDQIDKITSRPDLTTEDKKIAETKLEDLIHQRTSINNQLESQSNIQTNIELK